MASLYLEASDELAHTVWASHILSFLNPYTITASDKPSQPNQEVGDDDGADFDDDPDPDLTSIGTELLTANSDVLRQKFLDCICELLAHTKGWKSVTAAALREKEDEIEVDITRNNGFSAEDEGYLGSLKRFFAMQADDISHEALVEYSHETLESSIAYSAQRVDSQTESVAQLLKGSSYRPLQQHLVSGEYTEGTCLLGCCSATQEPMSIKAQNLLVQLLNFGGNHLSWLTDHDRAEQRCKIVKLAAATVYSQVATQATQRAIERMVPSLNPHKFVQMCRVLARPITCLRTLSQIARLLHNFRLVTFIKISPPAPSRLKDHQVPTIWEAWKYLGLPSGPNDRLPRAIARKRRDFAGDFRSACGSDLSTHCEIQLLMRYEVEPSLEPTLSYFGCSKKACFLCESFLALSPLKVRTRGRHGQCHPQWAVQPCNTENTRQRLKSLCDIVKQNITARLDPRNNPSLVALHQSSAVSELGSVDILELTQQNKNREVAEKKGQELREQRQILLDPRSVGPQNIFYWDLRTLCVMCQAPRAKSCSRCLSIWYCSRRCQKLDWPAHKLLCSLYPKVLETRLSVEHKLGIWFPRDTARPMLVWAPIFSPEWGVHYPYFDPYLGPDHGLFFTIPFAENKRRGLELDHYLTIYYCDWVEIEIPNKSVRAAVEACHGMTVPSNMIGDYVVMSGQRGPYTGALNHNFRDVTLADFRHALDYFSTYFDDTIRETPSGFSVLAVKVSHPFETKIYGRDLFTSVAIDRDFSSTSDISPLSQALGLPLRVCRLRQRESERAMESIYDASEEEESWENPYTQVLMTDIDPESENWGKTQWSWDINESILLRREDGNDLDLTLAKQISGYCLEVLKPLLDRAVSGEISRQDVLEEITLQKVIAWKSDDSSTGVSSEPRSGRGFVARIGSPRWEYAKQHSRTIDLSNKFLKERGYF